MLLSQDCSVLVGFCSWDSSEFIGFWSCGKLWLVHCNVSKDFLLSAAFNKIWLFEADLFHYCSDFLRFRSSSGSVNLAKEPF